MRCAHPHLRAASQISLCGRAALTPPDAPLEDFRALHKKLGIGRAVIVNASVHGTDNRVALDAIAVSDGTFRAVANIDDSITERGLRELHEGGFRGCRFDFVRHLGGVPDMAVFHRIVAMITDLNWHVDLHFDAIDLPEYAELLAKLPVRYCIDHMGRVKASDGLDQLPFRTLIELMQRDEKCWVKVCGAERVSSAGPPFYDAVPFARRIVETAPERVIWGTDWPHPNVKAMPKRRRSGRSDPAVRAGTGAAAADPGRQSGAPVRVLSARFQQTRLPETRFAGREMVSPLSMTEISATARRAGRKAWWKEGSGSRS